MKSQNIFQAIQISSRVCQFFHASVQNLDALREAKEPDKFVVVTSVVISRHHAA